MKIDFANLQYQYQLYKEDIDKNIQKVLNNSNYIMGEEVQQLERELEEFTGATHAITCSSGTDALLLSMMAVGIQPGDEVITTAFSFIATAETIALMKAVPVLIDIEEASYNINSKKIEAAITEQTKAIMPVSLYGQPADMNEINAIAKKHNLKVIIDGAQSFGATYQGSSEVDHCDIYTTSFFPSKPLGCYGDGGAVFTNSDEYAEKIRSLRIHGQNKRYQHKYIGMGARLDTIQAAVLLAKLPNFKKEITARQSLTDTYTSAFCKTVKTPTIEINRTSVWAQYSVCISNRDQVQEVLAKLGIPTAVHYPLPLNRQECFQSLQLKQENYPISEQVSKEVLSLPMNPFFRANEIEFVTNSVLTALNQATG